MVGTTKACVTCSRWTVSSQSLVSNWRNTAIFRPLHSAVMMFMAPAMWYSGAHSSEVPRGVPSAISTVPVT